MIDCPADAKLTVKPEIILHTHVQAEHCMEWECCPEAEVFVPAGTADIALRSDKFFEDCNTVWPEDRAWDTRGEEKYGIAGAVTERPSEKPLNVKGELIPGKTFQWQGNNFDIIALPGHNKRAIGILWREQNVLFSGDLIRKGGYLVNIYDQERSYGLVSGYSQMRDSLNKVTELSPSLVLPATGPVIDQPEADITALLRRIDWIREPAGGGEMINFKPLRKFGRWNEVRPGVYQNNNCGNTIVFIDDSGHGIVIDPDPCIWLNWESSCRSVNRDYDLLEQKAGLKTLDFQLITHYHGDHVQFCKLLKERYNAQIATTPDIAVLLRRNPLPCCLAWYGFPFSELETDIMLEYDQPFNWNGGAVTPVHTPGHCFAHAGYAMECKNERIVCTGDALMYGTGEIRANWPIVYNDTACPERSTLVTLRKLAAIKPELILGGHSHAFEDPDGKIIQQFIAAYEQAELKMSEMLHDKDMQRAMTPPGFNKL